MKKHVIAGFIAGAVTMGLVCVGVFGAFYMQGRSFGHDRYAEIENKLEAIDKMIDRYYLYEDDIDDEELIEGIYAGYMAGLQEPYTTYYSPEAYADVMESALGSYSGVGSYVSQNISTGIITFIRPFVGGPADKAGIIKDDVLYAVEGEEVTGVDINLVVARLKGEEGTNVNVTVYRPSKDEYIDLVIERAVVEVPTVTWQMLENNIGYIEITSFDEVTVAQFGDAVDTLEAQGAEKLIFDLRDNGGGLLNSVCDMLDKLLPEQLLMYSMDKNGKRSEEWAEYPDSVDMPMVVLVNGNTASASEIFTGALRDYDKAEIIGTKTFGKGIVQSIIPMNDGSAVKLTTAEYYIPSGVSIHGTGIEPDIVVEWDSESEEDNQLRAAIDFLNDAEIK